MKKLLYLLMLGILPWAVTAQTVILDHEAPATTTSFQYFGNCTLDGAYTGVIANPDVSGVNTSATVGEFVRDSCAATFAGGFSDPVPTNPVDLTTDNRVYMKVWMDHAGTVSLKLENSTNGGDNYLHTETVATPNTWVELEFDMTVPSEEPPFTAAAGFSYPTVVLFVDLGVAGTGVDEVTYFDDIITDFVFTLDPIDLPITWDDAGVDYTVVDFGGTVTTLDVDPVDPANTVAKTIKTDLAETWAGTTMSTESGLATDIPIDNSNTRMEMRVYSPDAGIPVRLKVEDASDPTKSVETETLTTVAGAWETLIFDFANEAPGTAVLNVSYTFNKASVFFNFGTDGPTAGEKTYYWDDIAFIGGGGTGATLIDLPITWDDAGVDYTVTDFGGVITALVPDPVDPANTVANTFKPIGAETWAGTTMSTPVGLQNPIPVTTTESTMTIRVYSPDAGIPVRLKIEDATDPTKSCETETLTTVANAWETMTFDFNNEAPGTAVLNPSYSFTMASVFFNFGTDGATAGDKTYFWDDVEFVGGAVLTQIDLPITWDETNVDYTVTDFGDNISTIAIDPTDGANNVMSTVKPVTAATWAGTTMSTPAGLLSVIPFTIDDTKMSVRVYSPDAGIPIRLKVEVVGDPTQSCETEDTTTVANAWETLTFDFSNEAPGTAALNLSYSYNMASIFFNFGTDGATAGEKTYLWDDVEFVEEVIPPDPLIDLPITWDDDSTDYTVTDFGDNISMIVADPTDGANNVMSTIKPVTAPTWAGTTMSTPAGFATVIPFTVTETTMSVRVYSPDAGIPVRLKVEVAGVPTQSCETEATTTVANAWETLVFDFNNEAPGTAALDLSYPFNMASIFFNFGTDGATAGEKTYLWDDIYFGVPEPTCSIENAPDGLSSSQDLTGVTLNWNPIANSVGCVVEGRKVGETSVARRFVMGFEVSSFFIPISALDAGATYEWRTSCSCDSTSLAGNVTPHSSIESFTVATLREGGLRFTNPVSSMLNMQVESTLDADAVVQLVDLSGRVVALWNTTLQEGVNSLQFDVMEVPNGLYLLNTTSAGVSNTGTVIVQH